MNTNSNISIFNSDNFGELRVIMCDGDPWFVAKDVCDALGFDKPADAVRGLDDDEKGSHIMRGTRGNPDKTIISESGLYSLILRSRKPEAKPFRRWVTHEVLPSIRKDGGYLHVTKDDDDITILTKAFTILKTANEKLEAQLAAVAPRAEKYDAYLDIGRNEGVGTFTKMARDAGIDVGIEELFQVLRFKHVLCSGKGVNWNRPYANYVKAGLMTAKPVPPEKREEWRCTPLVTPKGKDYLLPRLSAWVEEYREYQKLGAGQNFLSH